MQKMTVMMSFAVPEMSFQDDKINLKELRSSIESFLVLHFLSFFIQQLNNHHSNADIHVIIISEVLKRVLWYKNGK